MSEKSGKYDWYQTNCSMPIFLIVILLGVLVTTGFGCKWQSKEVKESMKPVELTYWRVWDNKDAFKEIIEDFKAIHPNISISYKKLRYEEYEDVLLNALAEDRGPDIFSIHNTWLRKYKDKISPLPETITLPHTVLKGTIKKETAVELKTTRSLNSKNLKNDFIDLVSKDAVIPEKIKNPETGKQEEVEKIYGLPLSIDTLVLFCNRDLLNNAGISRVPQNWQDFQENVKKLTKFDKEGNIISSGAAIGTSKNVDRFTDILSVLMMQNGAQITDEQNYATFHLMPKELKGLREIIPGAEALIFYTDFANPAKEVYTWNEEMPNSLDAFIQGQVAFFFGYSYHLPIIKARAPKLNFVTSEMPQITGNKEFNFANYWVETVSKKTEHPNEAWEFIQFMTSRPKEAEKYLKATKRPTALRELIATQLDDVDLDVFAEELLTAQSWYRGKNPGAMEKIFAEMIEQSLKGEEKLKKIVEITAGKVNQTMK